MNISEILRLITDAAVKNPVLLIAILLGVGSLFGAVKLKKVGLGPAAVLFFALALSAANPALAVPAIVGNLGLALFAYTVGLTAGPSFFSLLRKGSRAIAASVIILAAAACAAVLLGHLFGLDRSVMAGVYAGALTNTPALAAANEQIGGEGPVVGYSVTYIWGVLGMMLFAAIAVKKQADKTENRKSIVTRNIRVEKKKLPNLGVLTDKYDGKIVFSRIMRGDYPGHEGDVDIATDSTIPKKGDILTVIGTLPNVTKVADQLGHVSTVALQLDRKKLDFRRMTLSNTKLAGTKISDLKLERKFGGTVTRVKRGDVELLAADDLPLIVGDRIRIVAPREKMADIAAYLGDSDTGASTVNAAGLGVGLSLGILFGLLVWPLPGGEHFSLGVAGGSLLVGLLLGRVMKTGPITWSLPSAVSSTIAQLGMLLFLAYAGSTSGPALVKAFKTDEMPYILLAGFILTTTTAAALYLTGRFVTKLPGDTLAGTIAGSATQPAVLAHANSLAQSANINLGYALVYPTAMIVKVILAPLIGTLF